MIACRGLVREFGSFRAVNEVSFEVPAGQVCALLGPNGAGKSTIVKVLTGTLEPSSGEVAVGGFDVWRSGSSPAASVRQSIQFRRAIGVLPETLALFDDLTIEEHLHLSGALYDVARAETTARADQLMRILRLENGRHTYLNQCSYGMRKKTALAMALLHNPRVLFLDEPFEGIDPVTAETIRRLLKTVAARGVTVLLTSHILSLVDQVADRVMMMREGALVWNSTIGELPSGLERLYFELVESVESEEVSWLGSP